MVFEDESSDDNSSLPYMQSSSSTDGLNQSLEDPEYKGLELDLMVFCEKHGKASERLVAFEGTDTGRRFLACAEPEDAKTARRNDNLESALKIHHLTKEKNKLDATYDKAKKIEEKLTHEKLELKLQVADLLKGNEKLSEERVQLKLHVVELIKGEEEQKQKIKGIQAMLEE
nr:uncharacterized protein LOC109752605 [Aegilops tauschii subsp. strangulata]